MPKLGVAGVVVVGVLAVGFAWRVAALPLPAATLIAHEWGTFTALQDDDGTALGAINADDEPVPHFVCTNGGSPTLSARSQLTQPLRGGGKGIEACHPDVTLRLETPVIYFYPPEKGWTAPVNVRVTFRGGWLTEYYPWAVWAAPDLDGVAGWYPPLTSAARGSLTWNAVELNAPGELIATDDPVWTAPREVARAAVIKASPATDGRTYPPNCPEKFLFYRGVGHVKSPLRAVRDKQTDQLSLYGDLSAMPSTESGASAPDLRVPAAWLLEIRAEDGACAFRAVPSDLNLGGATGQALATLPASFAPGDFFPGRLQELQAAMRASLVAAGLFPDEAAAMLKTWELSYFKSPGRRLFYVTPRAWTEQVLPLSIDGATITRVMIGRIELVTPAQRASLARVAAGPCPDLTELVQKCQAGLSASWRAFNDRTGASGKGAIESTWHEPTLAEMKISVPAVYQDYLDLGRFRDALVLDEQKRHPTLALAAFIARNNLRAPGSSHLTLLSFLPGNENSR